MIGINFKECFGYKRIDTRGEQLHSRLFSSATRSIQSMSKSRSEQKAFYRFLHNDKATEKKLIGQITKLCGQLSKDKIVLSIQDTTEINLSAHAGRVDKAVAWGV